LAIFIISLFFILEFLNKCLSSKSDSIAFSLNSSLLFKTSIISIKYYLLIIIKYNITKVMKIFTNNNILSIDTFLSSKLLNKSFINFDSIAVRNSFGENLLSKFNGLMLSAVWSDDNIYLFPFLSKNT